MKRATIAGGKAREADEKFAAKPTPPKTNVYMPLLPALAKPLAGVPEAEQSFALTSWLFAFKFVTNNPSRLLALKGDFSYNQAMETQ